MLNRAGALELYIQLGRSLVNCTCSRARALKLVLTLESIVGYRESIAAIKD